jgi:phosphatidylglycerophosphate synthase
MIEQYCRSWYQRIFVDSLLRCSFFRNVHPLTLTYLGCLAGVCVLPLLASGFPLSALFALAFSGFLDTLDGSLARMLTLTSPRGAVSDIVCDRVVEFCVVLGLYFVDPGQRGLLVILMLGSMLLCITTFLVVGIFTINRTQKGFYYSPGLMERPEAFIFFVLMILFPSLFMPLAILYTVLTFFTALLRWWQFLREPDF